MKVKKVMIYGIMIIFAIFTVIELFHRQWESVAQLGAGLGLTFVPWLYTKLTKIKIPEGAHLGYSLFLLGAQFLGTYIGFYRYFAWWDVLLHLSSGILVGYIALIGLVTMERDQALFKSRAHAILIGSYVFAITAAGAVLWEIIEFTGDQFLGTNAQLGSLQDTMEDLICGTIVGGIFALYIAVRWHKQKTTCLNRLLKLNQENRKV